VNYESFPGIIEESWNFAKPCAALFQLMFKASRSSPTTYSILGIQNSREHQDMKHVLEDQIRSNYSQGLYERNCTKSYCIVCKTSGFVPEWRGFTSQPRKPPVPKIQSSLIGDESVSIPPDSPVEAHISPVSVIDGRTNQFAKLIRRKKKIECKACHSVVSLYFGDLAYP
jgi:hypothetical protein